MNVFSLGFQICKRTWKKLYFRPIHLVVSFIQPLFWLTIFGFLFERQFVFAEGNYLSYLLPGVCAMTVIQSSSQSGILFIKDFQTGFFGRFHYTSSSKFIFLFFKIFADYSRILIQVIVLFLVGILMNISHFYISIPGLLYTAAAIFLFTYFYASLSSLIALKTKQSELMATFVHLFSLPIIFTSTALVPSRGLPDWLNAIAQYNPLSHLGDIIRYNTMGVDYGKTAEGISSFGLLAVLAVLSFGGCVLYLRSIKYNE